MKLAPILGALAALSVVVAEDGPNPISKTLELMKELEANIVKDGEAEQKSFKDYFEWCDSTSKSIAYEIKTGESTKAKLTAKINELSSESEVGTSKIEELAGAISSNEAELKEATGIRKKEEADFLASEKELMSTIDTLERAASIIESESAKGSAALAQIDTSSMESLLNSLSVVIDAAGFTGEDRKRLVALAQQAQESDDDDVGAPAAAVYKEHTGGILETLEDLKEKAETELAEARKTETSEKHNYQLLKQSLDDQIAADTKDMDEEKSGKDEADEKKATAEGDLEVTTKGLEESKKALAVTQSDCMTGAADHEANVAARKEELKVIAQAAKTLQESTGGAEEQMYSLLQVAASSKMRTRVDLANTEVLNMVKKLAHDHHSSALAQLASRIAVIARYGSKNGGDPFKKVKGLIEDMIMKLEKEATAEATEKAYCDEEMSKTAAKKSSLEDEIAKLTSKIDQDAARSAALKEEVVQLEGELADIAKEQAEMDVIRKEQHAAYVVAKKDLEEGLAGVRKALGVLRDYYGSEPAMIQENNDDTNFMQQPAPPAQFEKSTGAGEGIISILEVCESDFATGLSKEESQESDAVESYEKTTQENKVSTATKQQDVKYKTQEAVALDKTISELSSDKDTSSTELSAVDEYFAKIKERCIAKPETYEERKARREAEIDGLKEALSILTNEAAFVQQGRRGSKNRRTHFMAAL